MRNQINNLVTLLEKKNKRDSLKFRSKIPKNQSIITLASGKGGVGKTGITVNLAIALSKMGKKILVFDGDFGMANIHILLGEFPEFNLQDFLRKRKSIQQVIFSSKYGFDLLPGMSAINEVNNLTKAERLSFLNSLKSLSQYDYILIDLPSGMSKLIIDFITFCGKLLLVTTPEPTSLADGYGLIKLLKSKDKDIVFYTIFNRCLSISSAKNSLARLKKLCTKHLKSDVNNLGFIFKDEGLVKSIYLRQPLLALNRNSLFSKNILSVAQNLEKEISIEKLCHLTDREMLNLI